MGNRMHGEVGDSGEVVGVHGVERQICGDRYCGDERVVGPGCWFVARGAKARRDATESTRGCGVEGQGVEGGVLTCRPRGPRERS